MAAAPSEPHMKYHNNIIASIMVLVTLDHNPQFYSCRNLVKKYDNA